MNPVDAIISAEAAAVLSIPVTVVFDQVATLIHYHTRRGGKVVTTGMGKAGEVARSIATTFSSIGTPAVFLHPAEAQHGDLGLLQPTDVLLAVSNSGSTREVWELVQLATELHPDAPLVVITGNPQSPLARAAKYTIATGNPPEVCTLGLTPTTSTTVMSVIGDVLCVLLQQKTGFTAERYAKVHHGGYLGAKARTITKNTHDNEPPQK